MVEDYTDEGPVWDPTLAAYYFAYNASTATFTPYDDNSTPTNWLYFRGHWGDKQYPDTDSRQFDFLGLEYAYVDGPTGPIDKDLERAEVCPDNGVLCIVRTELGP